MPRFSWSAVPVDLVRALATELDLAGDAPEAMGTTFGTPPTVDFVRAAWPVLLSRWLADDADARADVVAQLRAAGLGDHEKVPRTRSAQLAYLRTVRNTARLRDIVLDRFAELGWPEAAARRPVPLAEAPVAGRAPTDLVGKVEAAWTSFGGDLATALMALELGAHLRVTLDPTAGGTGDATYYLEFTAHDDGELHAESVGNAYLPAGHRLDRSAIAGLVALGWAPPGVVEGTEGNFGLRVPCSDAGTLADLSVRTLREVFCTPHPAFLTYEAQGLDAVSVPVLGGGARRISGAPVVSSTAVDAPLEDRVRDVVAGLLAVPVAELPLDADGELGIRAGSAMVFVRVGDDPPMVEVVSPVLTQVTPTPRLYEKVSSLTRNMPIGRLYVADDTVWASVPVFGRDFQGSHLSLALRVMTGLADELDDRLQGDFGGKVFFGDALPERRSAAEPDPGARTGMYL
jgi:hypothetical protein